MEKFDIEAFMNIIDEAGANKTVMLNLPSLEINASELAEIIGMAEAIYRDELGDHVYIMEAEHRGDPILTRLVALIDEEEILTC